MRKSINSFAWLCGIAAALVAGASFAEGNASNGAKIFKEGKGENVTACQTCHGDNGQGTEAMGAPRLAGQGANYIVKQLADFADGKRTPQGTGAVMPGFAKGLTPEERADVGAYVHTLKGEQLSNLKEMGAKGETYKGQVIAKFGRTENAQKGEKAVSACQSCHGYNGRGAAPVFPMIGRQSYTYLVNQLRNWRAAGSDSDKANAAYAPRENDPVVNGVGIMRAVAKNLSDDDINDVAAFLSNAKETTDGNNRVPTQD